jgi:hypothetical protein
VGRLMWFQGQWAYVKLDKELRCLGPAYRHDAGHFGLNNAFLKNSKQLSQQLMCWAGAYTPPLLNST